MVNNLPQTPRDLLLRWTRFYLEEGYEVLGRIPEAVLEDEFIRRESRALYKKHQPQISSLGIAAERALSRYKAQEDYEAALRHFNEVIAEDVYKVAYFLREKQLYEAHYLQNLVEEKKNDPDNFKKLLVLLAQFGQRPPVLSAKTGAEVSLPLYSFTSSLFIITKTAYNKKSILTVS